MGYRKRQTLTPSILELFRRMGAKAWVHDGRVYHDGPEDLRQEIGDNIERGRATGAQKSALFFLGVLLTALDRQAFSRDDLKELDHMGYGNGLWLLERLEELGND